MVGEGLTPLLAHFSAADGAALAFHVVVWAVLTWTIEHNVVPRQSAYLLMLDHRRSWMHTMLRRDPRMYDALMLTSLKQTATFFASTCLISVGAGAALIGQADRVRQMAEELSSAPAAPPIVWQVKVLVVLVFVSNALLKFLWSVRVYGYQAVLMAAVPNDPDAPEAEDMANRAADLNIYASRSFNRGLRAVYFSLAALTWLVSPYAFMAATLVTGGIVIRREYFSASRDALVTG